MAQDDSLLIRPNGLIEPLAGVPPAAVSPSSYAGAVPRLKRGEPAAPPDRRAGPRLAGDGWRGRLVDLWS